MEIIESSIYTTEPAPHWVKAYAELRQPSDVEVIMLHITGVSGGYGVSDQAVARHDGDRWAALMERFEGSQYLRDQELASDPNADGKVGAPYHYVIRPQEPCVIALHHPARNTWHGNKGNATSIGVAIDMGDDDDIDVELVERAFAAVVEHAIDLGFTPTILEGHRQHSNARGGDPGSRVWPILELEAAEFAIFPSITHTTGSGQPIPDSWRPNSTPTPEPPPATPSTKDQITAVQVMLSSWGHDAGEADGLWGPRTESALEAWVRSVD